MRITLRRLPAGAALGALLLSTLYALPAAAVPAPVVHDGRTQPVFPYGEAVRETVYVEAPMDSDRDGRRDRVAVAVLRPAQSEQGMKVATVMKATPYTGKAPRAATVPDPGVFSEWYDEYFVPRGYAVVEVELQGTGQSEGCPTTGGPADTTSVTAAIDWLNGRAPATYADGRAAVAGWSTGDVGMVGLSYDGTLATAAATTGVEGLKTIVPEGAISSWYDYARDQGVAYNGNLGTRYPEYQASRVASQSATARCGEVLKELGDAAADDTADRTAFWDERDYVKDAAGIRSSVLLAQGLADTKVRNRHFAALWQALGEHGVARKLWLHKGGHEDPLVTGGAAWQETLHRWMDHWLYRVDNGIMSEPRVSVQRPDSSWQTSADWPHPGSRPTHLWFGPASEAAEGGLLRTPSGSGTQSFTDAPAQNEAVMISAPEAAAPNRLAYLTPPLTKATHVSGTPTVRVRLSSSTASTPLTALLVDYGPAATPSPAPSPGLSDGTGQVTAELAPVRKPVTKLPIVSRGALDVKNRHSLERPSPLEPGKAHTVSLRLHAVDHVFPEGHRVGLVIVANDKDYIATDPAAGRLTLGLRASHLVLPTVGGR
ncbi:CocE/NonD family hydrolase [Nonomuraea longicatena]|uniref:CocE/NonD family hydrolase n=1 Tax=Nonomuraea longicatena TaxID=83682 RepID=UPI0031D9E263